jgi:4-amino-4-deoxy-L-arabinose transferase-like glycosyltransferase
VSELGPPSSASSVRRDLILLALAAALLFGIALGAHDLWNPNEPIYGEAVKEMAQRGTWSVPYVNDLVFGEKPILYYWLALASSKALGGISETSLRLPSVLAGIAIVLGVYLLVLPYAGRRRALWSGVLCLTTYQVWWVARTIQMDVFVAATTLWVILPVTRVLDHGAVPWKGWTLAGAVAGIGFLAKGPVTWICPGLTLLAYALVTRRLASLFRPAVLLGAAVCVAVAAPWYLTLWATGHTDVLHEVLIRQNFQRFSNPWDHVAPFWYYVPYFFSDMAPWSLFALVAWNLPRQREADRKLAVLSALWIVSIVFFFSLSKSKRDPYIVPVAPAAAILAAEVAVAFADERLSRARRAIVLAISWAFAAIFLLGGIAVLVKFGPKYPEVAAAVRWLAGTMIVCGVALGAALARARLRPGPLIPATLAATMAAFFLVAGSAVLPALDTFKSARPLCERLAGMIEPGDRIASYNFWMWRSEYRYYLGRPIDNLPGEEPLREAWNGPARVVLLVEGGQLAEARRVIGDRAPAFTRGVGSQTAYVFTNR